MWLLFVPIHVKSWPKAKLAQVEVGSNIAQNRLFSRVICGQYMIIVPIYVKSWPKVKVNMKQAENHLFSP